MYIIFDLLKKDNTPMNIASLKMDGCNYLGSMYQNNVVGRLFKRLKSVSNLPAYTNKLRKNLGIRGAREKEGTIESRQAELNAARLRILNTLNSAK